MNPETSNQTLRSHSPVLQNVPLFPADLLPTLRIMAGVASAAITLLMVITGVALCCWRHGKGQCLRPSTCTPHSPCPLLTGLAWTWHSLTFLAPRGWAHLKALVAPSCPNAPSQGHTPRLPRSAFPLGPRLLILSSPALSLPAYWFPHCDPAPSLTPIPSLSLASATFSKQKNLVRIPGSSNGSSSGGPEEEDTGSGKDQVGCQGPHT